MTSWGEKIRGPIWRSLEYTLDAKWSRWLPVVLAVLVGVLYVTLYHSEPFDDAAWYESRAWNLAQGRGYTNYEDQPTAYWPVGYPLYLSLSYLACGHKPFCSHLGNIALSAIIVWATYALTEHFTSSRRAAFLSATLVAIYPDLIAFNSLFMSELLYTALLLVGTLSLLRAGGGRRLALASGVVFGIAILTRPIAALIPLIVLFADLFVRRQPLRYKFRQRSTTLVRLTATTVVGIVLVLAPWWLRNWRVFNEFVFVSTNGGINLLIGNHPLANGTYTWNDYLAIRLAPSQDELSRDKLAQQYALAYMRENPIEVLARLPLKFQNMFRVGNEGLYWSLKGDHRVNWDDPQFVSSLLGLVSRVLLRMNSLIYAVCLLLTLAYLVLVFPLRLNPIPFFIILYHVLVTLIYFGTPRFHTPLIPFCFIAILVMFSTLIKISRSHAHG